MQSTIFRLEASILLALRSFLPPPKLPQIMADINRQTFDSNSHLVAHLKSFDYIGLVDRKYVPGFS